eukprot:1678146-Amphidinium_carterae.2
MAGVSLRIGVLPDQALRELSSVQLGTAPGGYWGLHHRHIQTRTFKPHDRQKHPSTMVHVDTLFASHKF